MVELVYIVHHRHAPLPQVQELCQLPVQNTSRNVVLSKSGSKLLPSHTVIHRLHGIERVPPCTDRTQQLLRCKAYLLLIHHIEQLKLLLQNMKPMLRVQRLHSQHEHGQVCPQEVLIGTWPLGTMGTTPVPAIAIGASMGKATNSLWQHLQDMG